MFRNVLAMILAAAVTLLGMEPAAYAQYDPVQPQPYTPAEGYPQYPQAPGYSQPQAYPQGPGYPPASYPQQYPAQNPQGSPYPQGPQYPAAGPPQQGMPDLDQQHGVARLSIVQGDVNIQRVNGELVSAIPNAPLVAQDRIQTAAGSRAEIELDSGNIIRLAPDTELIFADLEYHRYQIQLAAGTIIYRVLRSSSSQAEIDTPSVAVHPASQSDVRISVLDDGSTQVAVRSGQVEIYSTRGTQQLGAGQAMLIRGNPSNPEFQMAPQFPRDQFDDWSASRDRDLLASRSYQYVSPDVYGAEDLDAYGNWVPSQYGQVWQPQPPTPDWSPYSYGEWVSEPYYGWTWVDYAPWGWAPYHYGRWFWNTGYGWCWWPGLRAATYLWSPALVGFFGVGAALGWVALAPFEFLFSWWGHPWGGYRFGGFARGDLFHTYRNAAFRGGALYAPYNAFGGPHQRFMVASRAQLSNASLFRGGPLPVQATRASYLFSNRAAVANTRLSMAANRSFFQHQQPRTQMGFARTGSGYGSYTNSGRSGFAAQGNYGQRSGYASGPRQSTGGWQRFGDPGSASSFRQGFMGGSESSGWHSFGAPQQPSYRANGYGYGSSYAARPYAGNPSGAQRQSFTGGAYGGRSNFSAPRYTAPSGHYNAPAPHYSAPSSRGGGESFSRGGGGGGGSHGGGGHSSSGGHHR